MIDESELTLPWLAGPLSAVVRQQRGHALLLSGREAAAGFVLARRAAQAWLCEHPDERRHPCDECASCHLVRAGTHPDLQVLLPEQLQVQWGTGGADDGDAASRKTRKPSRDIKVEAVRRAIDWSHGSSSRGRGKALVIHPADAMNAVAANALLKTLEEPQPGMRLLLSVGDPLHILPTLRSRCQHLQLPAAPPEQALAWLRHRGVTEPEVLLRAAGGRPLRAAEYAAAGLDAGAWQALPRQLAMGDTRALAAVPLPLAVDVMQQLCHDLMAVSGGAGPAFFPPEALPRSLPADWAGLAAWSRELSDAARSADHPWNVPLRLDALALYAKKALNAGADRRSGRRASA